MNFKVIEGYLCKEIDTSGLFRRTKRHLKYFRIVHSSGKLNIKDQKEMNEMRSFLLSDLISVKSL